MVFWVVLFCGAHRENSIVGYVGSYISFENENRNITVCIGAIYRERKITQYGVEQLKTQKKVPTPPTTANRPQAPRKKLRAWFTELP